MSLHSDNIFLIQCNQSMFLQLVLHAKGKQQIPILQSVFGLNRQLIADPRSIALEARTQIIIPTKRLFVVVNLCYNR
jgi:hypothetical protein